jgi:hypothetical protein
VSRRPALARAAAIVFAAPAALVPVGAAAQMTPPGIITPVCQETCPNPLTDPAGAAACMARQQACTTKIDLYRSYMGQLGLATTQFALPSLYRDVLQPLFRGADLGAWRYAFGDRQPANNATTDCGVTYFNNQGTVNDLRNGRLDEEWEFRWLLHELRHFAQCVQLGGRDAYAKMWFGHLELAFLRTNSGDMTTLHDAMPMEGDAARVATAALGKIAPMRDRNGRLVRPVEVRLLVDGAAVGTRSTGMTGSAVRLTARTTGGSAPMDFLWSYRLPGETAFRPGASLLRAPDVLELTPQRAGTYVIRVRAGQNGAALAPDTASLVLQVSDPPAVARTATPVTTVRGPVSGSTLRPLGTLTVQVLQRSARSRRSSPAAGAAVTVGVAGQPKQYGAKDTDASGAAVFPGLPLSATERLTITARTDRCRARTVEHVLQETQSTVRVELVC